MVPNHVNSTAFKQVLQIQCGPVITQGFSHKLFWKCSVWVVFIDLQFRNFPIMFQNYQNTSYIMNITFIFERCPHSMNMNAIHSIMISKHLPLCWYEFHNILNTVQPSDNTVYDDVILYTAWYGQVQDLDKTMISQKTHFSPHEEGPLSSTNIFSRIM